VSVVTLDQIQGLQPKRLADIFYNVPACRSRTARRTRRPRSTFAACRTLAASLSSSMARGRTISAPATTHGSFFLDPELVGGVDIVRGPRPTFYGSARSAAWSRSATKDFDDVVRPGERWGVDMSGSYGTNKGPWAWLDLRRRARRSEYRRVRRRGLSHAGQLQGRAGTEIGNTGNELHRPDETHGAAARATRSSLVPCFRMTNTISGSSIAGDHHGCRAYSDRKARRSMLPMPRIIRARSPGNTPGGRHVVDWTPHGCMQTGTDKISQNIHNRITSGGGVCTLAKPRQQHLGCVGDRRGYLLDTVGIDVTTRLFQRRRLAQRFDLWFDAFQDDVKDIRQPRKLQHHDPQAACARFPRFRAG